MQNENNNLYYPFLEQNMYIVEEGKHCIVIDPYYDEKQQYY